MEHRDEKYFKKFDKLPLYYYNKYGECLHIGIVNPAWKKYLERTKMNTDKLNS